MIMIAAHTVVKYVRHDPIPLHDETFCDNLVISDSTVRKSSEERSMIERKEQVSSIDTHISV